MLCLYQERRILHAPRRVVAHRQRPQRVAMVALAPADDVPPLRLADLHEVLPRHLERRLDGLGAAGDEIDVPHALGRIGDQGGGELFGDGRGEEARMGIGEAVELGMHGRQHVGMRMAEAGDGGPARGVDIVASLAVADGDAPPGHRHGIVVGEATVEDVGHGAGPDDDRGSFDDRASGHAIASGRGTGLLFRRSGLDHELAIVLCA